jgi:uncharacterized protein YjbI with pentapeptide repeats
MVEIKSTRGTVLLTVDAPSLSGADLFIADPPLVELVKGNLRGTGLARVNLQQADLRGADLRGTRLTRALLDDAVLQDADLSGAQLVDTSLLETDLTSANLQYANMGGANLFMANLGSANLTGARLDDTILNETAMRCTILTNSVFAGTSIIRCPTLHLAEGLETIRHEGESSIDVITLRACVNDLPNIFLQGIGYTLQEIETLRAMYKQGINYSCFLSYAHANRDFAGQLRTDLLANNVNCFQDTQDLRGGQKWEDQINQAIKQHDKLLLVCSRQSIYRPQVVREIIQTIDSERATGEQKLFPIRLDDHILSEEMMNDARENARSGVWSQNWVHHVRKYQIPNFSGWKDPDTYQEALQKLVRDLKVSATR